MKALTLRQPWAAAVAAGIKTVETRSWRTNYRGPLAIHAAKGFPKAARDFASVEFTLGRLPGRVALGAVIATANLVDVRPTEEVEQTVSAIDRLYGDYTAGRWAWFLADVEALSDPVGCRGMLGLWEWTDPR